jgi:heme-degrading monooxygenase HmoA
MYARVSSYQTDNIDGLVQGFQSVTDAISQVEGFSHAYFLFNRTTGHAISIAIWESVEQLEDSTPLADQLRAHAIASNGSQTVSIESYEVLHAADHYSGGSLLGTE